MIVQVLALLTLVAPGEGVASPALEDVRQVDMLRNGAFDMQADAVVPGGIPWWIQTGAPAGVVTAESTHWLVTKRGSRVVQPIPAYAPLVAGIELRGTVQGLGRLTWIDGTGREVSLDVGTEGQATEFEWKPQVAGAPLLVPRFDLRLEARGALASWSALKVLVPFPFPTKQALRVEVIARLHDALDPWIERSVDRVGPRSTGLFSTLFDAITGEPITTYQTGSHPLADSLLEVVQLEPDERWIAALEAFTADYLDLCFHPETDMPRLWDATRDVPLDSSFLEVHVAMRFLLDLHERGPLAYRARALKMAEHMAEGVLATGILPDGNVAALYRPRDGASSNETRPLRRLDMPAQMTRLAALNGDQRLLDACRGAVATLLYTHYWPGSWNRIDPGFDDDFGHYAARAGLMAHCFPEEPLFRRVIDTGWDRYRVLWDQSLKFGGSMAADQVRCWKLLIDYSELRPAMREALDSRLAAAVHSHLRGQQYGNGAWGDVTYYGFQPAVDLQVGDLPGTPTNLLEGLAMLYGTGLGLSDDDLRALFCGVLRSSYETYGREFGLLSGMREVDGPNHAGGSIRIAPALTLMLERISDAR